MILLDAPDPVRLRVGVLSVGNVMLASRNAEAYGVIGQRVKRESGAADTVLVTPTNGQANSGYVPTDDAFGRTTFQVLGSRLQAGCAEQAIVTGNSGLLERLSH